MGHGPSAAKLLDYIDDAKSGTAKANVFTKRFEYVCSPWDAAAADRANLELSNHLAAAIDKLLILKLWLICSSSFAAFWRD